MGAEMGCLLYRKIYMQWTEASTYCQEAWDGAHLVEILTYEVTEGRVQKFLLSKLLLHPPTSGLVDY